MWALFVAEPTQYHRRISPTMPLCKAHVLDLVLTGGKAEGSTRLGNFILWLSLIEITESRFPHCEKTVDARLPC